MKVITMESSAFRSLMEQIAEIAAHIRAVSSDKKAVSPDRLLPTREAAYLLNVSTRIFQCMRSEQHIGKMEIIKQEQDMLRVVTKRTLTSVSRSPHPSSTVCRQRTTMPCSSWARNRCSSILGNCGDNPIVTSWIEKNVTDENLYPRYQTLQKGVKYRIFKNLLFAVLDKKQYFCPH